MGRSLLPEVLGEACSRPPTYDFADATCATRGGNTMLDPAFLRGVAKIKESLTFPAFVELVRARYAASSDRETVATRAQEVWNRLGHRFNDFIAFAFLRMWVAPVCEAALLVDRAMYVHESAP